MAGRLVLYHGGCPDGMTAAWAAWSKYKHAKTWYRPCRYGDPVPDDILPDMDVEILDFSWPRAELIELHGRVKSLLVLDHHKTAQEDLQGLPFARFDLACSGAMLAWQHYHVGERPHPLVTYVQDRDLWRFSMPSSREASQWLRCVPYDDFEAWDEAAEVYRTGFDRVAREGAAMLKFQNAMVRNMVGEVQMRSLGGHSVPVVNASVFFSEVGTALATLYPDAPFGAYWFLRGDGKVQWGMRSSGFDVSEVAKGYGGGGHATAAGFVTDLDFLATGLAEIVPKPKP